MGVCVGVPIIRVLVGVRETDCVIDGVGVCVGVGEVVTLGVGVGEVVTLGVGVGEGRLGTIGINPLFLLTLKTNFDIVIFS